MNIDAWTIKVECGGICDAINVNVTVLQGQCDLMLLWSVSGDSIPHICEKENGSACQPKRHNLAWTKRMLNDNSESYDVRIGSDAPKLYAVIVGYTSYVSVSIKLDATNILRTEQELYRE
eukprot:TRINITY_DN12878_c0_g1_i3.p1 TRINITY_DN12878_c0_g1~~TRINITY_DN12878_c0_g1_i3.p1  ORF type:complete len:120 (-),score=15.27 TRINITY_DN12878_c0_g1_i3:90-449(-)